MLIVKEPLQATVLSNEHRLAGSPEVKQSKYSAEKVIYSIGSSSILIGRWSTRCIPRRFDS